MFVRIFTWGVQSILKGPGKTWMFSSLALSLFRFAQRQTGRRELVDLSRSKPGDTFIIEHLNVTHKEQMKSMKRAKKVERKATKQEKKDVATAKRELKRAHRSQKRR